jgi:sigma-B regulation protein RsbU (phosphoserine phosphatase)
MDLSPTPVGSGTSPLVLRVLVVEDSEFDARILVAQLRTGGWAVAFKRVASGPTLLATLQAEPWDLILCDHTMPGFSAPEALQILQGTGLDVPFIIISGGIEEGVAIDAMKAGAQDFLKKGDTGRLIPAVQRELKDAASRRARRDAEATLRDSELRYRSVWENSTDAVLLLDTSGVVRFANPAVAAVFGWASDDLIGQTMDRLQPEELPAGQWWNERRSFRPDTALGRRKNGDPVEIDVAITDMRMGEQTWVVFFFRDVTERRRVERELQHSREEFAAAREIQQRLFPKSAPEIAGFEFAGVSQPAVATGGDYFDFLPMTDGALGIVVADVSGHGVGPALLMAEARAYLRPLSRRHAQPAAILDEAEELLREDLGTERYITLCMVRLDPVARRLTYANAGHPAAQVLNAAGDVKAVLRRTGRALGRQGGTPFTAGAEVALESGDLVLLLTDGIDEAMRSDGECFGLERALEIVRQHRTSPLPELVRRLCQAARDFTAPDPQNDDLTVVLMRVL